MMRFLTVDDDPLFSQLLVTQMEALGFTDVVIAGSGSAALAILDDPATLFDCIVLDVRMPGMDGITLCRKIRSLAAYRATPIVMVTSMSDRSYIDSAFDAGATDYITKPLDRLELKARLGMVARLHEQTELNAAAVTAQSSSPYDIEPAYEFSEPLVLPNVDRLISYVAMENYLLTLGLKRSHSLRAFAVQVENAYVFYATDNRTSFVNMIGDVASAVLEGLKTEDVLFAYAGSGTFVCVARGEMRLDAEDLALSANLALATFNDLYAAEQLPAPILHFGEVVRSSAFGLSRPSKLPELAISMLQGAIYKSNSIRPKLKAF